MKFAKILTALTMSALPAAAIAHPVHVAETGHGHSHWLAIAAFVAIAGIGYALLRRRNADAEGKIPSERG